MDGMLIIEVIRETPEGFPVEALISDPARKTTDHIIFMPVVCHTETGREIAPMRFAHCMN